MIDNEGNNGDRHAVLPGDEKVVTSVSVSGLILALGSVKAKKVNKGSYSGLVETLTEQDLKAAGWLNEDGKPTEKAKKAFAESEASKAAKKFQPAHAA